MISSAEIAVPMEATMRAAVWHARQDVRIEDVPESARSAAGLNFRLKLLGAAFAAPTFMSLLPGPIYIPHEAPHPLTAV